MTNEVFFCLLYSFTAVICVVYLMLFCFFFFALTLCSLRCNFRVTFYFYFYSGLFSGAICTRMAMLARHTVAGLTSQNENHLLLVTFTLLLIVSVRKMLNKTLDKQFNVETYFNNCINVLTHCVLLLYLIYYYI